MANYHMSVQTIGRSAGRSACAAAAYRAGEAIHDQRTGLDHDYTRRSGVEHTQIVAPADAPAWAQDRQALWNGAEAAESRKNSVVAREIEVSLPAELTSGQRQELALELAREIADRHQVAVDVAIHAPGREGDDRNHHAHMMLTTRQIGPDGFGAKTRELDDRKQGEVARWRERWGDMQNERLAEHGHDARVDHRSLAAQGVEREPQIHLGPIAAAMERRGAESDRGLVNGERQEEAANPLAAMSGRELRDMIRNAPTERDLRNAVAADPQVRDAGERAAAAAREAREAQAAIESAQYQAERWREAHPLLSRAHDLIGTPAGPLGRLEREIDQRRDDHAASLERQHDATQAGDERRAEIEPAIRDAAEPAIADAQAAAAELEVRGAEAELEQIEEHGAEAELEQIEEHGAEAEADAGAELDIADDFDSDDDAGDDEHQAAADEDAWR